MKTKPILFNTEMVQAILQGRKTQTRRVIKGVTDNYEYKSLRTMNRLWDSRIESCPNPIKTFAVFINSNAPFNDATFKSKYQQGDILWVRETFADMGKNGFLHKANSLAQDLEVKWKPSIFMPKEACRLWLEVIDVRAERLQDISEADAKAEGIKLLGKNGFDNLIYKNYPSSGAFENGLEKPKDSFFTLWESINGKPSLDANPWVWVYTFKRCEMPKDFLS